MKSKLHSSIDRNDIILIIIILVLIITNLILYIKKIYIPKQEQEKEYQLQVVSEQKQEETQIVEVPQTDEEIIKYLSSLTERDRIEYYCGIYFKHIEKKEYESAYNLLYDEFKQNYFPTLEQYVEYIEKTYPDEWALEYDDITRQGTIYVLRLIVLDVFGTKDSEKVQRIVVKENNYNDFVMSFQVI